MKVGNVATFRQQTLTTRLSASHITHIEPVKHRPNWVGNTASGGPIPYHRCV
ncbi:hypothetical protein EDF62_2969 [Leucobacter luti]|uniref:Uncharacterized protein n=1 Tax=Leucobacter luti TaxID=340320 RepID=A0A4V3CXI5_9MICO|nr:hypothetical protein EDF62_2969 [Leucobacter luti]